MLSYVFKKVFQNSQLRPWFSQGLNHIGILVPSQPDVKIWPGTYILALSSMK